MDSSGTRFQFRDNTNLGIPSVHPRYRDNYYHDRSVGKVVPTPPHNALYMPPSMIHGYAGHVPTVNFQIGQTYPNATKLYFNQRRDAFLNSSLDRPARGPNIPIQGYSSSFAIEEEAKNWERYSHDPPYKLSSEDTDRKNEINKFYKLAQCHRDFYRDTTGTKRQVDHFILPTLVTETFNAQTEGGSIRQQPRYPWHALSEEYKGTSRGQLTKSKQKKVSIGNFTGDLYPPPI